MLASTRPVNRRRPLASLASLGTSVISLGLAVGLGFGPVIGCGGNVVASCDHRPAHPTLTPYCSEDTGPADSLGPYQANCDGTWALLPCPTANLVLGCSHTVRGVTEVDWFYHIATLDPVAERKGLVDNCGAEHGTLVEPTSTK
jgi:hypothetical protein